MSLTFGTWTCSLASFLGYVDLLGTTYQAPTLATGFASHFAQPLLREAYEEREAAGKRGEKEGLLLSREEAEAVLDNGMKVLFYRDARSLNKVGLEVSVEVFACQN
jgi:20S proteasome subunit beta 7